MVNIVSACFSWLYPVWDSLCFLGLIGYSLSDVREIFDYNVFKYFLRPFFFLFFFWDPYNSNVDAFNIVPEVLLLFSFLFILFPLFCSLAVISTIFSSSSLILSSASVILLLIFSSVLLSLHVFVFFTNFFLVTDI